MAVKVQFVSGGAPVFTWLEKHGRTALKLPYVVNSGETLKLENGAGKVLAIINCETYPPQVTCEQTELPLEQGKRSDYVWPHKGRVILGFTWLEDPKSN